MPRPRDDDESSSLFDFDGLDRRHLLQAHQHPGALFLHILKMREQLAFVRGYDRHLSIVQRILQVTERPIELNVHGQTDPEATARAVLRMLKREQRLEALAYAPT